jgi:hypothetical protein
MTLSLSLFLFWFLISQNDAINLDLEQLSQRSPILADHLLKVALDEQL